MQLSWKDGIEGMSIIMTEDQAADAAAPVSPEQVIEIAREVTSQLAPGELLLFDDVADAWSSSGRRKPRRVRGPKARMGIEAVLLCELLFPIITGAIGQVLGTVALERIRPRPPGRHAAGAPRGVELTSEQADGIRDKCLELAQAERPSTDPTQVADAIIDTLRHGSWRS